MRILALVLFAVALPSTSPQDRSAQNPGVPGKPFTLTQVWTLDATYSDQQHGRRFRSFPALVQN